MRGIAISRGVPATGHWHQGSQVFQLFPSLGQFEGRDDHVVVAITPRAVDTGRPETTVFKCEANGDVQYWYGLDGGAEALSKNERIVGRFDADAALANLSTGYYQVTEEEHQALRPRALRSARNFAQQVMAMTRRDANDYARNNWGMFAARAVCDAGQRPAMLRTINHAFDELPAPVEPEPLLALS